MLEMCFDFALLPLPTLDRVRAPSGPRCRSRPSPGRSPSSGLSLRPARFQLKKKRFLGKYRYSYGEVPLEERIVGAALVVIVYALLRLQLVRRVGHLAPAPHVQRGTNACLKRNIETCETSCLRDLYHAPAPVSRSA